MQLFHIHIEKLLKVLDLPLCEKVAGHFSLMESREHQSLQLWHLFVLVIHLDLFLCFPELHIVLQGILVFVDGDSWSVTGPSQGVLLVLRVSVWVLSSCLLVFNHQLYSEWVMLGENVLAWELSDLLSYQTNLVEKVLLFFLQVEFNWFLELL